MTSRRTTIAVVMNVALLGALDQLRRRHRQRLQSGGRLAPMPRRHRQLRVPAPPPR
jgi:hypothetical protein